MPYYGKYRQIGPSMSELLGAFQLAYNIGKQRRDDRMAEEERAKQQERLDQFQSNFAPETVMTPGAALPPQRPTPQIGQYPGGQFNMPQSPLQTGVLPVTPTPAPNLPPRALTLQPNPQEAFRNAAMQDLPMTQSFVGDTGMTNIFAPSAEKPFKPQFLGSPNQGIYSTTPEGEVEQKLAPQKTDEGLDKPEFFNKETNQFVTWDGENFRSIGTNEVVDPANVTKATASILQGGEATFEHAGIPFNPNGRNQPILDHLLETGQVTQEMITRAERIALYRDKPIVGTQTKNPFYQKVDQLVGLIDPRYDTTVFNKRKRTMDSFSGQGTDAQNLTFFNTAVDHLGKYRDAAQRLSNLRFRFANIPLNKFKRQYAPEIAEFEAAASALSGELTKVFRGNLTAEADIDRWLSVLDINMTPEQHEAAQNQIVQLMLGRIGALTQKYEQGMGYDKDIPFLTPQSRKVFEDIGIDPNQIDYVDPNFGHGDMSQGANTEQQLTPEEEQLFQDIYKAKGWKYEDYVNAVKAKRQ